MDNRPKILVYAGPNGSGKSTFAASHDTVGIYINADEIKKVRQCSDLEAAKEAERLRELCLDEFRNFTFESVLSTNRNIDLLRRAKDKGYYIESIFFITADVEINILRIKSRVFGGGHGVPEDKVRSRYYKSIDNIRLLLKLSDECYILDNTITPTIICAKTDAQTAVFESDLWSVGSIEKLIKDFLP